MVVIPDLTTLTIDELDRLSVQQLSDLLLEPAAAIGFFDLLGLGREGGLSGLVTGLEFTLPENRMHFGGVDNRMHYTLPENRMQFAVPEED